MRIRPSLSNFVTNFSVHREKDDTLLIASSSPSLSLLTHERIVYERNVIEEMDWTSSQCSILGKRSNSERNLVLEDKCHVPKKPKEEIKDLLKSETKASFEPQRKERIPVLSLKKETPTNPKSMPKRRTGRRKLSTLGNKSISKFECFDEDSKSLEQWVSRIPTLLRTNTVNEENLKQSWSRFNKRGLFKTPDEAEKVFLQKLCGDEASLSTMDHKMAEQIGLQYLWIGEFSKAADVLFAHQAMTGEFLPFFVPAGRMFYETIVRKYVSFLQSIGETHLAAMHLTTIGETAKAVETYQDAKMHDDAISLASLKFLKEDQRIGESFLKRAQDSKKEQDDPSWEDTVDNIIGTTYSNEKNLSGSNRH